MSILGRNPINVIHVVQNSRQMVMDMDICPYPYNGEPIQMYTILTKWCFEENVCINTGEKPHKCDTFGAQFSASGFLKEHVRIHAGEKRFKCDTCGAQFSERGRLKTHVHIHSGEKPYKCHTSSAQFSASSNLRKHVRVHAGKNCKYSICGAQFSISGHVKTHVRIHAREEPYKCDICGAQFSQSGALKKVSASVSMLERNPTRHICIAHIF